MIKIYGSKRSSAFRCVWFLEELGVEYETVPLDFQKGENKTPEYLQLNPNGKIPTMVDGDFVLWESVAINYYLMEKYQALQFAGKTPEEHGLVNQWTLWSIMHLYESFHPVMMQKFRNLPESESIKAAREQEIPRYLTVLNNHLSNNEFVALDYFTLADLTVMSVVRSADFIGYDLSSYVHIVRWMAMVAERPAYKKVIVE